LRTLRLANKLLRGAGRVERAADGAIHPALDFPVLKARHLRVIYQSWFNLSELAHFAAAKA
jgi:hypothetical protein